MKTNQKVQGGFDLNAFANQAGTNTPPVAKPSVTPQSTPVKEKKPASKGVGGRPPLPAEENLSDRAQVRMTAGEMKKIKAKAGLVPVSAYLRAEMKKAGIL